MRMPKAIGVISLFLSVLALFSFVLSRNSTQTSAQSVIFSDSFDANYSAPEWTEFLNYQRLNPDQWYWENGAVHFDPERGSTIAEDGLFMLRNQNWTDYTVEADVTGSNAGLWFRGTYQESAISGQHITGYYLMMRENMLKLWEIQTADNCKFSCHNPNELYDFANPQLIEEVAFSTDGRTRRLKVELRGSNIKCYVDGQLYIDEMDTDFTSGTIGFKAYKYASSFDNVVVTGTAVNDTTPPVCAPLFDKPIKAFEGVHIHVKGSLSYDTESSITEGSWTVTNTSGAVVSTLNTMDGYINDLPAGGYRATLHLKNNAGLTTECSTQLSVYSTDGFTGTVHAEVVDDYVIPSYDGPLYADNNPKRAVIVSWPGKEKRFIFWHESAYEPHWEFPNGSGMKYQFFEGANSSGELLNKYGRMDENSFPEIIHNDDKLAIVKWWYYDMNMDSGERVAYAEEYFYFFPNGLILREMELKWGLSFEPMEMILMNPVANHWWDSVEKVGDRYAMSTLYDIATGAVRENWGIPTDNLNRAQCGADGVDIETMEASNGTVLRSHIRNYEDPFIVYGDAGYIYNPDIKDLCSWLYPHFVHGTIGWLNSEWKKATEDELRTYPTCTPLQGVNHPGNGPYYWLIGASDESTQALGEIGRAWLEHPYLVPCSAGECTLTEPPTAPEAPSGDTWTYNSSRSLCEKSTGDRSTCKTINSLSLNPGWNFIALPEDIDETTTLWLHNQSRAAGTVIDKASVWTDRNLYAGTTYQGNNVFGNAPELSAGTPVFCHVDKETQLQTFPYPSGTSTTTLVWKNGWNAVSLRSDHIGSGSGSDVFLSETLPELAEGIAFTKASISHYAADRQQWVTQVIDGGQLFGTPFKVMPDSAYFVFLGSTE